MFFNKQRVPVVHRGAKWMLLLEPSLHYAPGGNFPSAARREGAAAAELFHVGLLWALLGEATPPSLWIRGSVSELK